MGEMAQFLHNAESKLRYSKKVDISSRVNPLVK